MHTPGIYDEHHLTCIHVYVIIYIIYNIILRMSYGNYENERGEREIGKEENTTYI